MDDKLYEADYYTWLTTQVSCLKRGDFKNVDMDNLIEELEEMGRSEKRALESYLTVIVTHLLKWKYQPSHRSSGWNGSIINGRRKVRKLLRDSPSLKSKIPELYSEIYEDSLEIAIGETGLPKSIFPDNNPFNVDEVLNVEFYPDADS